jgi:hypothetical protein
VNVIRHQNKRVNVITSPVELQQTTFDFRAHIRPAHVASTQAGIEPFLHAADKARFVFVLFVNSPWLGMQSEPNSAFVTPLTQKWLRH